jgi:hypothetical protein
MSDYVQTVATNGILSIRLPISDLAHSFTYDEDGNMTTDSVIYDTPQGLVPFRQTFTWGSGDLLLVSGWEPDP